MDFLFYSFFLLRGLVIPVTDQHLHNQSDQIFCAPNSISLNHKTCIELTETPSYLYKDFLLSIADEKGEESIEFINMLPYFDTWTDLFQGYSADQLKELFLTTDQLALMPIIGISYDQATAFNLWRTKDFKEQLANMPKSERSMYPREFKYRLPSKKEWGLMRYQEQEKGLKKRIRKAGDRFQKSFKLSRSKVLLENQHIEDVYAIMDERLSFFNLYHNVSEMTKEAGISVGGSWKHPNPSKAFNKEFPYEGPNSWTGFRSVFEIIN
jgi:hypothetical protein